MAATPARIGFILQQFRRATSEDAAVKDLYGNLARKSDDPIETWFDDPDDAQAMADARQALLGTERRRFRVMVRDVTELLDLSLAPAAPLARYADTEREVDRTVMVCDLSIDLARDNAALTLWG